MKKYHCIVCLMALVAFCFVFVACNDSDSTTSTSSDTKLTNFYVHNDDSMTTIADIEFIIDNDNNTIYNTDSLPFQAPIEALVPYAYGSTIKTIVINDSVTYTGSDTIDFRGIVTLTTTATDGESTRVYTVNVCVHQVDPDLYAWNQLSEAIYTDIEAVQQKTVLLGDKLCHFAKTSSNIYCYTSNDGATWTKEEVTGIATSTDLSGIVVKGDSLFVADGGAIYGCATPTTWSKTMDASVTRLLFVLNNKLYAADDAQHLFVLDTVCQDLGTLPAKFPASDYSTFSDYEPSGIEHAYVVGGKAVDGTLLGTVWSTNNGTYWSNLAAAKEWFTPRYGVAAVQYAKGLLMYGGADEAGVCDTTQQWYSPDYGLTWRACNEKEVLPETFTPRYNASIVIDGDRFIYIIGGQTNDATLSDVWVGRKNSEKPGFIE